MKLCVALAISMFLLMTSSARNRKQEQPSRTGKPYVTEGQSVAESPSTALQTESAQPQYTGKPPSESELNEDDNKMASITVTIGDSAFLIKLYDNDTARAFLTRLPVTLNMSELNGNEKYYYLPDSLPVDSQRVGSINAGELMLYSSDCLVLFYESFTTPYNYTKLGYIESVSGLVDALGRGSVEVRFAASE